MDKELRERELRIRVQPDHPDAGLIDWLREHPDGRSMILQAIRAFWLADMCSGKAIECWNALLQQCNYLISHYNIPTPISTTSPFTPPMQQAQAEPSIARIRVQPDHPDAGLIDWLREHSNGRGMVLQAISAFWLAEVYSDQATGCWNALSQQCNYLILKYNIPIHIVAASPFAHSIQQAQPYIQQAQPQPFVTQPVDRRISQPMQVANPFE